MDPRYPLLDPAPLLSPSLLVYRDLVRANLEAMVRLAGGAGRLRPHVKTHKMPAIVRMAESMGIRKHKAATIAEAEMVATAGGTDVMLAYPLVGPNVARLARLMRAYANTTFRATVDDPEAARLLSEAVRGLPRPLPVMVDLDLGMGRTGIAPGDEAVALYRLVADLPGLDPDGLSAYDGHIHDPSLDDRRTRATPGAEATFRLRDQLEALGLPVPRIVLGGTPTFPVHATLEAPGLEFSPGTCVLHDVGYGAAHPDLPFTPAAVLLTRVVSRPRPGRITLDLGHKAVAADPPAGQRVTILGLRDPIIGKQNEEHLIVDTPDAPDLPPGTPLLAIPTHICPTCALHRRAYVIDGRGAQVDEWEVTARDRMLVL